MIHFLVAFALLLHALYWGAGLAMLAMPWPWRRFWPVLTVPAGLALQSSVVWFAAHAGLPGTASYAWWGELLPFGLLGAGLTRISRYRLALASSEVDAGGTRLTTRGSLGALRAAWIDLGRFGVVWATTAGSLALLVLPIAIAAEGLTTISLGSCDAADYAVGARVLQEFARGDRGGFLGLTEVVRIGSVDNFFDYWLRLNHFTPSALIALNGTILDCAPHQLVWLLTAVLLAGTVPLAFWSARSIFGYSGGVSIVVAALFGASPIMWYAVAHVSPGQLLAAQAVVLLTWSGLAMWRGRLRFGRGLGFSGVLAIGYWLVLGSYNFFLLLCLVPVLACVAGWALRARAGRRWAGWLGLMLAPLLVCGGVFFGRVAGLAERFSLLQTYDFGWRIPALTAEGWLGMLAGPDLSAWDFFGIRWVLSAGVVGFWGWALLRAFRERRPGVWIVVSVVVPVLAGYFFLQARGAKLGTNASYDAYKLFAVFYPLLLPAFCWWVTLRRSRKLHEWFMVVGVAGVVAAFNLVACGLFIWNLSRPPLIVDGELRQLRRIEQMEDVRSINVLIPDMWSRLWANAFLLRKAQYFESHTYEGRRNTLLQGEWDLEGGLVKINLPGNARRELNSRFALVDTRHPAFLRARPVDGWHPTEHSATGDRWAWTSGEATFLFDNPQDHPLGVVCAIDGWSVHERTVSLVRAGGESRPPAVIREKRALVRLPVLGLPPGPARVVLQSHQPPARVPGDPRPLGVAVFRFIVTPQEP